MMNQSNAMTHAMTEAMRKAATIEKGKATRRENAKLEAEFMREYGEQAEPSAEELTERDKRCKDFLDSITPTQCSKQRRGARWLPDSTYAAYKVLRKDKREGFKGFLTRIVSEELNRYIAKEYAQLAK